MAEAQGFTLQIKNSQGAYVPLYPNTAVNQIHGWDIQNCFGPYVFELTSTKWVNNQQTFDLPEVTENDIAIVTKVLEGTADEMKNQDNAYSLLNPTRGVETLDGKIRFTTQETPEHSYKVQVFWTR